MDKLKTTALSLNELPKVTSRSKKRVGRGFGSGKGGHTSGRGQKGQRSRRTIPWWFEGGQLPLVHRLPFWRGKGRLNPLRPGPVIVKTSQLEKLPAGSVVDLGLLIKEKIVSEKEARTCGIKILFDKEITKKLTVKNIPMSKTAAKLFNKPEEKSVKKTIEKKTIKKAAPKKTVAKTKIKSPSPKKEK